MASPERFGAAVTLCHTCMSRACFLISDSEGVLGRGEVVAQTSKRGFNTMKFIFACFMLATPVLFGSFHCKRQCFSSTRRRNVSSPSHWVASPSRLSIPAMIQRPSKRNYSHCPARCIEPPSRIGCMLAACNRHVNLWQHDQQRSTYSMQ